MKILLIMIIVAVLIIPSVGMDNEKSNISTAKDVYGPVLMLFSAVEQIIRGNIFISINMQCSGVQLPQARIELTIWGSVIRTNGINSLL